MYHSISQNRQLAVTRTEMASSSRPERITERLPSATNLAMGDQQARLPEAHQDGAAPPWLDPPTPDAVAWRGGKGLPQQPPSDSHRRGRNGLGEAVPRIPAVTPSRVGPHIAEAAGLAPLPRSEGWGGRPPVRRRAGRGPTLAARPAEDPLLLPGQRQEELRQTASLSHTRVRRPDPPPSAPHSGNPSPCHSPRASTRAQLWPPPPAPAEPVGPFPSRAGNLAPASPPSAAPAMPAPRTPHPLPRGGSRPYRAAASARRRQQRGGGARQRQRARGGGAGGGGRGRG